MQCFPKVEATTTRIGAKVFRNALLCVVQWARFSENKSFGHVPRGWSGLCHTLCYFTFDDPAVHSTKPLWFRSTIVARHFRNSFFVDGPRLLFEGCAVHVHVVAVVSCVPVGVLCILRASGEQSTGSYGLCCWNLCCCCSLRPIHHPPTQCWGHHGAKSTEAVLQRQ